MRLFAIPTINALLLLACTLSAQQEPATLHHFKNFPPGQYRQVSQAFRGGQPMGQPVVDTHCAAPLSAQGLANLKQMQATAGPSCSKKVAIDTPTLGEWLQTCNPGVLQTVIRSTFKLVDDHTITMDTNMTVGGQQQTSTHSTLKYLGSCPAGMTSPVEPLIPAMPKPSAEDCAQLPEMRQQAKEATVESCHSSDVPPTYAARCEAAIKITKEHLQQFETMCKR